MSWTPPAIPARQRGWDAAGAAVLQRHMDTPFAWGTSDCLTVVRDLCRAITGVDPWPPGIAYGDEAGAREALLSLGFTNVEEALRAVFPPVPGARAMRFDAGVVLRTIGGRPVKAAVVVNGMIALGRDDGGPVAIAIRELTATFAIGAR